MLEGAGSAGTLRRVTEQDLDLVVLGGGGHVGLPLALAFADTGWRVGIYDIDRTKLEQIGRGEMPFREDGADELLPRILETGRLELSADPAMMGRTERLIVVIGTPVDEFLHPSMTIFEKTVAEIAPHVADGSLVILRSTVYPGTTEFVTQQLQAQERHIDVAFCPERIAEGFALKELRSLPRSSVPTPIAPPSGRRTSSSSSGRRRSARPRVRRSWRSCSRTRGAT